MKRGKYLASALLIAAMLTFPAEALCVNKLTPVFMFGFASSFNDSTVYLTEIQKVDSTWIDSKNKFLYGRQDFAYQLTEHLRSNDIPFPTCIVVFAEKRKNIEKKYLKFKKRYTTKGNYIVKHIDANSFAFSAIIPDTPEATYTKEELKAAIKKEKETEKQQRREIKKKAKAEKKDKKEARRKAMAEAKKRAKELKQSRQ